MEALYNKVVIKTGCVVGSVVVKKLLICNMRLLEMEPTDNGSVIF